MACVVEPFAESVPGAGRGPRVRKAGAALRTFSG